jgi:arylsulfatase A-like enzyme
MNRRQFLGTAFAAAAASAARRPNMLIILADDLGYADLGFQGCRDIPTPHLDALAKGGVRFTSGLVSHPFCSPTRAGLMTGRYQQRFGHENNPRYDPRDEAAGLPRDETTLPQVLREAGYATGIVGKWHLGATPSLHPMQRGFQEMFGFLGGGHDYFRANPEGETREYLIPLQRDGRPVVESEYLTDAFSREAAAFVRRHRSDPFFLYLAYNTPHTPQQASDKYLDRFHHIADEKRRNYAAMVSAMDDGVGRVLSTLAELQIERDTLVLFLSDNGGPITVNGSSNAPLRGAKGQVYEGGIRVPFVARWPGRLAAGKTYREPVISLDLFPTALAAAGVAAPSRVKLDGVNLLPYLEGQASGAPHERLFWRTGGGVSFAVREGRYKLVRPAQGWPELYDLDADVGETRDLAASKPEVRERLLAVYQRWNQELMPPRFESPQPARKKAAGAGALPATLGAREGRN